MNNWKREAILKLVAKLKGAGFRVFLANEGEGFYGFYTDQEGARVVSFQLDFFTPVFSGNYKSKKCGTGWRIATSSFNNMINENPPQWATRGENVKLSTLADHLKNYQNYSNYLEV